MLNFMPVRDDLNGTPWYWSFLGFYLLCSWYPAGLLVFLKYAGLLM
jgi:hypothetical protein